MLKNLLNALHQQPPTFNLTVYNILVLDKWDVKINYDSGGDHQLDAPEYDKEKKNFSVATWVYGIGKAIRLLCRIDSSWAASTPDKQWLDSTTAQMCAEEPSDRPTPQSLLHLQQIQAPPPLSKQDQIVLWQPLSAG